MKRNEASDLRQYCESTALTTSPIRRTVPLAHGLIQEEAERATGHAAEEVQTHERRVPEYLDDRRRHEVERQRVQQEMRCH